MFNFDLPQTRISKNPNKSNINYLCSSGEDMAIKHRVSPSAYLKETIHKIGDLLAGKPGDTYDVMNSDINDLEVLSDSVDTKVSFLIGLDENNSSFRKQFITHMEQKYHVTLPAKYHAK